MTWDEFKVLFNGALRFSFGDVMRTVFDAVPDEVAKGTMDQWFRTLESVTMAEALEVIDDLHSGVMDRVGSYSHLPTQIRQEVTARRNRDSL